MFGISRRSFHEQLDGNPGDERPAYEFDIPDLQQLRHEEGDDHSQNDRRRRTEDDSLLALMPGQGSDGHGYDNGVVPCKDQVDNHNAEKARQEIQIETDTAEHPEIQVRLSSSDIMDKG